MRREILGLGPSVSVELILKRRWANVLEEGFVGVGVKSAEGD